MSRTLHQIKFVDLKQSKVIWNKSAPKQGRYEFEPNGKVYIDYNSDASALPDHKVQWNRNDPRAIDAWRYGLDYDFVRYQDKLYWPEGIVPNSEGYYVFQDAILMQCPALIYAERKQKELKKSLGAVTAAKRKFQQDAMKDGMYSKEDEYRTEDMLRH